MTTEQSNTPERPAPTSAVERQQYLDAAAKVIARPHQDMETMWAHWDSRLTADFDQLLEALGSAKVALENRSSATRYGARPDDVAFWESAALAALEDIDAAIEAAS